MPRHAPGALLANAKAMALAHVTAATKDPAGGRIVRLPNGDPSGVFVDNAKALIERVVPAPTHEETKAAIVAGAKVANRWGSSVSTTPASRVP